MNDTLGNTNISCRSASAEESHSNNEFISIVGLSGRFPECESVSQFMQKLHAGEDLVTESNRRWPSGIFNLPKRVGHLKDIDTFDASLFKMHNLQGEKCDPQLKLLLQCTYEALLDAAISPSLLNNSPVGVFVGACFSDAHDHFLQGDPKNIKGYENTGCAHSMYANRISYTFNLNGPSMVIDTACSSSLVALSVAVDHINNHTIDIAIVGGVNINLRPQMSSAFKQLMMLSPDGSCKSFDESANGYCRSEAVGVIVLARTHNGKIVSRILDPSLISIPSSSLPLTSSPSPTPIPISLIPNEPSVLSTSASSRGPHNKLKQASLNTSIASRYQSLSAPNDSSYNPNTPYHNHYTRTIYANVLGIGTNNDGFTSKGITYPSVEAQTQLNKQVLYSTGLSPNDIGYIEAHGTGTKAGDGVELLALDTVYGLPRSDTSHPLLLGSIKSNMGHSEGAAGVVSVIKVCCAIEEGLMPPNLHYQTPNVSTTDALITNRIKVNTTNTDIHHIDAFAISSFGFGGSNAHLILGRDKEKEKREEKIKTECTTLKNASTIPSWIKDRLIFVAGRTEGGVERMFQQFKNNIHSLLRFPIIHPPIIEHSHQWLETALPYRAFSLGDFSTLNVSLVPPLPEVTSASASSSLSLSTPKRKIHAIFTGNGGIWIGMGKDLYETSTLFRNTIDEAEQVAQTLGNSSVLKVILGTASEENVTSGDAMMAQIALQIGITRILRDELQLDIDLFAGHSAGEVTCAWLDGCISLKEAMIVAYLRNIVIDVATRDGLLPVGRMYAVGLSRERADEILLEKGIKEDVVVGCHNDPNGITLSGDANALDVLAEELEKNKIFCRLVPTKNVAHHSPMLRKLFEKLLGEMGACLAKEGENLCSFFDSNEEFVQGVLNYALRGIEGEVDESKLIAWREERKKTLELCDNKREEKKEDDDKQSIGSRKRTSRWISSCCDLKRSVWDEFIEESANAFYFCWNFIQPVEWVQALQQFPKDAIVLEIGPHALLQSSVRRTRGDLNYISLMKKNEASLPTLLTAIGKLYQGGILDEALLLDRPTGLDMCEVLSLQTHDRVLRESLVDFDKETTYPAPTFYALTETLKQFYGSSENISADNVMKIEFPLIQEGDEGKKNEEKEKKDRSLDEKIRSLAVNGERQRLSSAIASFHRREGEKTETYIKDHVIDTNVLVPAAAYVRACWFSVCEYFMKQIGKQKKGGEDKKEMSEEELIRESILGEDGLLNLLNEFGSMSLLPSVELVDFKIHQANIITSETENVVFTAVVSPAEALAPIDTFLSSLSSIGEESKSREGEIVERVLERHGQEFSPFHHEEHKQSPTTSTVSVTLLNANGDVTASCRARLLSSTAPSLKQLEAKINTIIQKTLPQKENDSDKEKAQGLIQGTDEYISGNDFYTAIKRRGYNYQKYFRMIRKMHGSLNSCVLEWIPKSNWVSFVDGLLQALISPLPDPRGPEFISPLCVPVKIQSILLRPDLLARDILTAQNERRVENIGEEIIGGEIKSLLTTSAAIHPWSSSVYTRWASIRGLQMKAMKRSQALPTFTSFFDNVSFSTESLLSLHGARSAPQTLFCSPSLSPECLEKIRRDLSLSVISNNIQEEQGEKEAEGLSSSLLKLWNDSSSSKQSAFVQFLLENQDNVVLNEKSLVSQVVEASKASAMLRCVEIGYVPLSSTSLAIAQNTDTLRYTFYGWSDESNSVQKEVDGLLGDNVLIYRRLEEFFSMSNDEVINTDLVILSDMDLVREVTDSSISLIEFLSKIISFIREKKPTMKFLFLCSSSLAREIIYSKALQLSITSSSNSPMDEILESLSLLSPVLLLSEKSECEGLDFPTSTVLCSFPSQQIEKTIRLLITSKSLWEGDHESFLSWKETLLSLERERGEKSSEQIVLLTSLDTGAVGLYRTLVKEGLSSLRLVLLQDAREIDSLTNNSFLSCSFESSTLPLTSSLAASTASSLSALCEKLVETDLPILVFSSLISLSSPSTLTHIPQDLRHLLTSSSSDSSSHMIGVFETENQISSFQWKPYTLHKKHSHTALYNVHYSSLNFKDVMLAYGKIDASAFFNRDIPLTIGFEFSGRNSRTDEPVMGFADNALSSIVETSPSLTWPIPSHLSLEEAATLPVVYSTAYYSLFVRSNLLPHHSILIHAGAGGVGLAAIRIALERGCTVYTTCSSGKRDILLSLFPRLRAENVFDSRNDLFGVDVMKATQGKGVDVVLNSLSEEKLTASLALVKQHGTFIEIGKFDITNHSALGMQCFVRNISFVAIDVDQVQFFADHWDKTHKLVAEGLRSGEITPLPVTVFKSEECENAIRYMAEGKHIGKVIIKVSGSPLISQSLVSPSCSSSQDASFSMEDRSCAVLFGGCGGFGLSLTHWLLKKGAKRLLLTRSRNYLSGYQALQIKEMQRLFPESEILVLTCDVTSQEDCSKILQRAVENDYQLHYIFHLAMRLQDSLFSSPDTNNTSWKNVLAPKVKGVNNILTCLQKSHPSSATESSSTLLSQHLKKMILFSSISAGLGNTGQSNYSYANSYFDSLIHMNNTRDMTHITNDPQTSNVNICSIQFGYIGDVGVAARSLDQQYLNDVMAPQSLASCLRAIEYLLLSKEGNVVLQSYVPKTRTQLAMQGSGAKEGKGAKQGGKSKTLLEVIVGILKLNLKTLRDTQTLDSLGVDSMQSIEIQTSIRNHTQVNVPVGQIAQLTIKKIKEMEK